jgi:hypothetical protein
VLFTFPSRYLFTIGRQLVFSLTQWSASIHTRLHLYRVTQELPRRASVFGYGPFTLYGAIFHSLLLTSALPQRGPTTPPASRWFGLFRFRSPLLTESFHFLFLWLLRCFTSPGIAHTALCIQAVAARHSPDWVIPFGNPRVKAYLPLSVAYRSLSRPSSPIGTKAFIICSS